MLELLKRLLSKIIDFLYSDKDARRFKSAKEKFIYILNTVQYRNGESSYSKFLKIELRDGRKEITEREAELFVMDNMHEIHYHFLNTGKEVVGHSFPRMNPETRMIDISTGYLKVNFRLRSVEVVSLLKKIGDHVPSDYFLQNCDFYLNNIFDELIAEFNCDNMSEIEIKEAIRIIDEVGKALKIKKDKRKKERKKERKKKS